MLRKECGICGQEIAIFTCSNCGNYVCRKHFIASKNICTACFKK